MSNLKMERTMALIAFVALADALSEQFHTDTMVYINNLRSSQSTWCLVLVFGVGEYLYWLRDIGDVTDLDGLCTSIIYYC